MFSRANLLQSVQNTKQILTDLEETLLYLEIPSGPIPFVLNGVYRSDHKNRTIELNPINELISESSEKNEVHSDDHKQEKGKCILPINENEVRLSNWSGCNDPGSKETTKCKAGNNSTKQSTSEFNLESSVTKNMLDEAQQQEQSSRRRHSVQSLCDTTISYSDLDLAIDNTILLSQKNQMNSDLPHNPSEEKMKSLNFVNSPNINGEKKLKSKSVSPKKRTSNNSTRKSTLLQADFSTVSKLISLKPSRNCQISEPKRSSISISLTSNLCKAVKNATTNVSCSNKEIVSTNLSDTSRLRNVSNDADSEVNSNQHASNNLCQNAHENFTQVSRYETGNYSNGNSTQVISKPSRIDVRVSEAPLHYQRKRKSFSEIRWTYDLPELDDIEDEIFMFSNKQNSDSTLQRNPSLGNINTQQINSEKIQHKSERSNSEPLQKRPISMIKRTKASSNCCTAVAPATAKNPSLINAVNELESKYDNGSCGDERRKTLRKPRVKSYKEPPLNCKLRRP
ncbi:uncharacterized protein LOC118184127 [Stegodyphus dumicola]|uniref:uncharacterized protein LOC118184127 n=1 Tax=Stegodyphus dumicola TaxID=202533 RepID=UPI0015A9F626|nr:uncharacterized protein LOC118184127 [Stegodyphus dumicola]